VARVVTPAVVAIALMLQNAAMATAAIVLANLGDKSRIISLTLLFEWNKQATSEPALTLESYQISLLN
jgi:hypothetical protein